VICNDINSDDDDLATKSTNLRLVSGSWNLCRFSTTRSTKITCDKLLANFCWFGVRAALMTSFHRGRQSATGLESPRFFRSPPCL
jgi:hypothetical protein